MGTSWWSSIISIPIHSPGLYKLGPYKVFILCTGLARRNMPSGSRHMWMQRPRHSRTTRRRRWEYVLLWQSWKVFSRHGPTKSGNMGPWGSFHFVTNLGSTVLLQFRELHSWFRKFLNLYFFCYGDRSHKITLAWSLPQPLIPFWSPHQPFQCCCLPLRSASRRPFGSVGTLMRSAKCWRPKKRWASTAPSTNFPN